MSRHTEAPIWVVALRNKDLSASEFRLWMLLRWYQGGNGSAWPSQESIGGDLGLTRDGVRKITGRLEGKGWLRITRPTHTAPGRHLEYQVVVPQNTQTGVGVKHADGGMGVSLKTRRQRSRKHADGRQQEHIPRTHPEEEEGAAAPICAPDASANRTGKATKAKAAENQDVRAVFDHWNSFAGRSAEKVDVDTGRTVDVRWRGRKTQPDGSIPLDAATAITSALAGFSLEDTLAAVSNYAKTLLSADTFWTYEWTVVEFFTRREGRAKTDGFKWWRFLPNNFDFEKYRPRRKADDGLNLDGTPEDEILAAFGKEAE